MSYKRLTKERLQELEALYARTHELIRASNLAFNGLEPDLEKELQRGRAELLSFGISELMAEVKALWNEHESSFIPMAHQNKSTVDEKELFAALDELCAQKSTSGHVWGYDKEKWAAALKENQLEGKNVHRRKDGLLEVAQDTWLCTAHAPGSEVEVKKGEKCFCGRAE